MDLTPAMLQWLTLVRPIYYWQSRKRTALSTHKTLTRQTTRVLIPSPTFLAQRSPGIYQGYFRYSFDSQSVHLWRFPTLLPAIFYRTLHRWQNLCVYYWNLNFLQLSRFVAFSDYAFLNPNLGEGSDQTPKHYMRINLKKKLSSLYHRATHRKFGEEAEIIRWTSRDLKRIWQFGNNNREWIACISHTSSDKNMILVLFSMLSRSVSSTIIKREWLDKRHITYHC